MGVVYPHITIKDTEDPSLLQFDATNNTVLVPVPVAESFIVIDSEGNMVWEDDATKVATPRTYPARLYTDAKTFIADYEGSSGVYNYAGPWKYAEAEGGKYDFVEPIAEVSRYCFTFEKHYAIGKLTGASNSGSSNKPIRPGTGTLTPVPIGPPDPLSYTKYEITYTPEKSYLMVIELLKRGLPVLVKPIPIKGYGISAVDSEGDVAISTSDDKIAGLDIWEGVVSIQYEKLFEAVQKAIVVDHAFDEILDKNMYSIKFITSGAYPNMGTLERPEKDSSGNYKVLAHKISIYETLTKLAAQRGDAIALLDHRETVYSKEDLELIDRSDDLKLGQDYGGLPDLYAAGFDTYKFAAAFTPWCEFEIEKYSILRSNRVKESLDKFNLNKLTTMPGSFAYLMAYAYSIQANAPWFAAAGVTRGQIPQMVKPLFEIGDAFMHVLQGSKESTPPLDKVRFNPVMNTGSYGYRIWGNRVAAPYDVAGVYKTMYQEFLNVRTLLCDIKKQIYAAAMRTTFEPNDDITWVNFKVLSNSLLDKMKSGRGLLWYKWTKEVSEERATIKARLTIRPIEAVEAFDITVFLTDQEAEFEE